MIAAQKGHNEMVRILLGEGKCKKDQADAVNDGLQYVYMLELVYPGCACVYATCVLDVMFMEYSTDVRMFNTMISRKKTKVNFLPKPFECT